MILVDPCLRKVCLVVESVADIRALKQHGMPGLAED